MAVTHKCDTCCFSVQRGEPTGVEGLLKACMQQTPTEAINALARSSALSQRRKDACKRAAGILRLYNHLHVVMKVCFSPNLVQHPGAWTTGGDRASVAYTDDRMSCIFLIRLSKEDPTTLAGIAFSAVCRRIMTKVSWKVAGRAFVL
jgi:hypothetical protein